MNTVKAKLDIVFKKVFADPANADILRGFLADMMEVPRGDIGEIIIDDPEEMPDENDGKMCRLDLKVRLDKRLVNIELQVKPEADYGERSLFYWSRLYAGGLRMGESYGDSRECVAINILGFNMFDCKSYHSEFGIYEKDRHEKLTDKLKMYFFELKKLGECRDMDDPRKMWLRFIDSETEEELDMIDRMTTQPELKKATMVIRKLSADEKERRRIEKFEDSLHDDAAVKKMWMNEGRALGKAETERKMLNALIASGIDPSQIPGLLDNEQPHG